MQNEILIAAVAVLSVLFIGVTFIYFRDKKERYTLRDELNEKSELSAKVPILEEELKKSQESLDLLRDELSKRDVLIAQARKDIEYQEKINLDLKKSIDDLELKLETQKEKTEELISDKNRLLNEKSALETRLALQEESNEKLKKEFEEQGKKLELRVNEIMQNVLDGKLKKFDDVSLKSLEGILKPFRENLDSFRKRLDDTQESSTKKFAELSKEIEHIAKAGMSISKEAENLANALKSKKQMQGGWGEMILESVLEYSGLIKGQHYEIQRSYKDEDGNIKRPDVVLKLPQNKTIIIDSKVSLNDYNDYIRAENDEQRAIYAKKTVLAFKNQIDNLASKEYAHYKKGTLQYVFMFVPIEGAFALAVSEDPSLYEYALKKHIAIVNPSTLSVTLHTIYLYWQSEQSSGLAIKLFDEAGRLYDKMYSFAETFSKIGTQLQTLNGTYETAYKQISEGRGNILGRVENLKKLGARTSKSLKSQKIEFSELDTDEIEVEFLEKKD